MEKVMEEMRRLVAYIEKEIGKQDILGVCLSSRKNLCIHEEVCENEKAKGVELRGAT